MATMLANSHAYGTALEVTLDPSNIPAGQVSVETFSVRDVYPERHTLVDAPSIEDGVRIINARCETKGTLEITFWNFSGAGVNPASQTFFVTQI